MLAISNIDWVRPCYSELKHGPHPNLGLQAVHGTFAETQKACRPLKDPNSEGLCSMGSGPMMRQGYEDPLSEGEQN